MVKRCNGDSWRIKARFVGKKKSSTNATGDPQSRTVCRNRRARHEYEISDEVDCGIVLTGSEVKSIRNNQISIEEAYAKIENGELWLLNADIAIYPQANVMNHEPRRKRKLLLKRRELEKLRQALVQQGYTIVPLEVFFRRGLVKVRIALGRGRKQHDKRQAIKKREAGRAIRDSLKQRY